MTEENLQSTSCAQKVIYLRNGVKQGNPNQNAKRCGAVARTTGLACRGMAVKGKNRCRLHGGRSTGAKTPEGLQRCRKAAWKHGCYSYAAKLGRLMLVRFIKEQDGYLNEICCK